MRRFLTNDAGGQIRGQVAPPFADHIAPVVLAAGTLYRHPVPAGAGYVVFSLSADFWARAGEADDTITIPGASATTGLAAEFNPAARRLGDETHILLIAETACKGSVAFYG